MELRAGEGFGGGDPHLSSSGFGRWARGQERQEGPGRSPRGGGQLLLRATIRAFLAERAPHTWSPRVQVQPRQPLEDPWSQTQGFRLLSESPFSAPHPGPSRPHLPVPFPRPRPLMPGQGLWPGASPEL